VVGVDMLDEMLEKSRGATATMGLDNLECRHGLREELPVPDGGASAVISDGVFNLCDTDLWMASIAGGLPAG